MFRFQSRLFKRDSLLRAIAEDQFGPEGPARISRAQNRTNPAVKKVQKALLLWDPGALPQWGADGVFGAESAAAIHRFKVEELLVPEAEAIDDVGPRTVQRLDAIAAASEAPGG